MENRLMKISRFLCLALALLIPLGGVAQTSTQIETSVIIYKGVVVFSNAMFSGAILMSSNGQAYASQGMELNMTNVTPPANYYDLQPGGIHMGGATGSDKFVTWGDIGSTNWGVGTYRDEQQRFFYLYNLPSRLPIMAASQSGRIGWNHPDSLVDYHSLWSGTGVDDLDFSGTNTANQTYRYQVSIVATGISATAWRDTWTWRMSADNGLTWFHSAPTTNRITNSVTYPLSNGVAITFGGTNGHKVGESWTKMGWSQLPVASTEIRPRRFQEALLGTDWTASPDTYQDVSYDFAAGVAGGAWGHTILSTTNKNVMLGSHTPVNSIFVNVISPAVGLTLVTEYWSGSAWVAMALATNVYIDGTANMTTYGTVQYERDTTVQAKMTPAGRDPASYNLYWYRFRSTTLAASAPMVGAVTPHSEHRLSVYSGMLSAEPVFWVGGRGNTYVQRAYMTDTNQVFADSQLITQGGVLALIAPLRSKTLYFSTDSGLFAGHKLLSNALPATAWAITNAMAAGSNVVAVFSRTNRINSTSIAAGKRYGVQYYASKTANVADYSTARVVEIGNGVTNVVGESAAAYLTQTAPTLIALTITSPATNITVGSTNTLGVIVYGYRSGVADSVIIRGGGAYQSLMEFK